VNPQTPVNMKQLLALCDEYLCKIVDVKIYNYSPCYLWHDRPLYNDFGEQIEILAGDTIYLHDKSTNPASDLFHELGHFIGRTCNTVGNSENGFNGSWEQQNTRLIAQVSQQMHWSAYLNLFSTNTDDFKMNAASELWAELFMLWHLQPEMPEARLVDASMTELAHGSACIAIADLAARVRAVF